MALDVTVSAREVLARSVAAARRFNPTVIVRLVDSASGLVSEFAQEPMNDDMPLPVDGAFVASGVEGTIDVQEPHDQLVLRPADGSV